MTRRALVTGAAAGLAAGIAPLLASDGFSHIAITYRSTEPDATLTAIERAGAQASATHIDYLADDRVIEQQLSQLITTHGPFDTLIHAVGPLVAKRFAKTNMDEYREVFDGNMRSAVLTARAVLPHMRESQFGRIVFFGANGASEGRPFVALSLYQAAKAAVTAFARSLALEEAASNITVNVIEPGDIRDKQLKRSEALTKAGGTPRGRPGSYEDVADVLRFLVAPQRDFVTGAVIAVTGGLSGSSERTASPK